MARSLPLTNMTRDSLAKGSELVWATPTLQDIPQELFEQIIDDIDEEDLLVLRKVTSRAHIPSLHLLAEQEHFVDYSVLLCNRRSLENACAVAENPILGPTIRRVTIFVDEVCIVKWETNGWCRWHKEKNVFHDKCDGAEEFVDDEKAFCRSEEIEKLLTRFFRALAKVGKIKELEIAAGVDARGRKAVALDRVTKYNWTSLSSSVSVSYETPHPKDQWNFGLIAKAFAATTLKVETIDVNTQTELHVLHPIGIPWGIKAAMSEDMESHLKRMIFYAKNVRLHICCDVTTGPFHRNPILKALSYARNLKTLHLLNLSGEGDLWPTVGRDLRYFAADLLRERTTFSGRLRFLSLRGLEVRRASLLDFIGRNLTIQELELENVNPTQKHYLVSLPRGLNRMSTANAHLPRRDWEAIYGSGDATTVARR